MVREYTSELYEPAAASAVTMLADNAERGKALANWKRRVNDAWPQVKVVDLDVDTSAAHEGDQRTVRAHVELGALDEHEITVQALHGPIDSAGSYISAPEMITLRSTGDGAFEGTYEVGEAGPYGVTVRAIPQHPDLISPMDMGLVAWAV